MNAARAFAQPFAAAAIALAAASGLLVAIGANPAVALGALVEGALGDRIALENTVVRMGPLLLVGLGVALSFRCGIWNIGGEGQLYVGALAATALVTRVLGADPGIAALPLALGIGALAGALWAGIAATLKIRRGVSEVLSTILLNFVAVLLVAWAVHGPLQEASGAYPQSDAFPDAARLAILPGLRRVHVGLALAAALPFAIWFLLFRTAAGLRLRAVGLSPDAARYAHVSPDRETARVLLVSGALAGLAGALEVCGVTGRLFENLASGYGFTAIAVALLARLNPIGVLPAAFFFAALASGSGAMQRVAAVPSVAVQVIEALVILFSVSFALPKRAGAR
jgi:simple sugar transport system permease protein